MKKKNEFSHVAHATQHACTAAHRHGPREADLQRETAHDGEIPGALMFLQNRPHTSPKSQLSPNAISPSLKPPHLTPWISWNSSRTPLVTQRTAAQWPVTQHGCVGHQGPTTYHLMGRSPSLTQAAMLSSDVGDTTGWGRL